MSESDIDDEALLDDLQTLLDRWGDDVETLSDAGKDIRSGRLAQCHAELEHFLEKHRSVDSEIEQSGGCDE